MFVWGGGGVEGLLAFGGLVWFFYPSLLLLYTACFTEKS